MIGTKTDGRSNIRYYRLEFGNVKFYRWLQLIGLTPSKSKTIGKLDIPDKLFIDFLRGSLDGDGYSFSYWDPIWRNSFRFYIGFSSASLNHLLWLESQITRLYSIKGRIGLTKGCYKLVFAKYSSLELAHNIYYKEKLICLKRKKFKIDQALDIISKQAGVSKLVDDYP